LEFLKKLEKCQLAFKRAINVLKKYFDPDYPLISEFQKSLLKVTQKIRKEKTVEKK
jgi:hypothetical protein